MVSKASSDKLSCSFCGKSQDDVKKLIAGPSVYICNECVDLCNDIIEEEIKSEEDSMNEEGENNKEKLNEDEIKIYGNEDQNPSPEQVNQLEAELAKHGKNYKMYRYDDAGHGLWYYDRPMYRQEQAMDSWNKTLEFFDANLR